MACHHIFMELSDLRKPNDNSKASPRDTAHVLPDAPRPVTFVAQPASDTNITPHANVQGPNMRPSAVLSNEHSAPEDGAPSSRNPEISQERDENILNEQNQQLPTPLGGRLRKFGTGIAEAMKACMRCVCCFFRPFAACGHCLQLCGACFIYYGEFCAAGHESSNEMPPSDPNPSSHSSSDGSSSVAARPISGQSDWWSLGTTLLPSTRSRDSGHFGSAESVVLDHGSTGVVQKSVDQQRKRANKDEHNSKEMIKSILSSEKILSRQMISGQQQGLVHPSEPSKSLQRKPTDTGTCDRTKTSARVPFEVLGRKPIPASERMASAMAGPSAWKAITNTPHRDAGCSSVENARVIHLKGKPNKAEGGRSVNNDQQQRNAPEDRAPRASNGADMENKTGYLEVPTNTLSPKAAGKLPVGQNRWSV